MDLELIPFISFEVEEITPYDKYEDMDETPTHYSLMAPGMELNLQNIKNFKELKTNVRFQTARKMVHKKDFLGVREYENACTVIAKEMNMRHDGMDIRQRIEKQLENTIKQNNTMKPK